MSPETAVASVPNAGMIPAGASTTCTPAAADLLSRVVVARDLDQRRFPPPTWLWQGFLGPGKTTLLTSQWKSGKTTPVSRRWNIRYAADVETFVQRAAHLLSLRTDGDDHPPVARRGGSSDA